VASVPTFGHWYPRVKTALGHFDYDRRGILDRDHVRFFTRRSFERLAREHGYAVRRRDYTGLPLEVVERGSATTQQAEPTEQAGLARRIVARVDRIGVTLRPTLFAYQFVYELVPR
jgi:hypothetical protein